MGFTKKLYIYKGELPKKGEGLGEFADLRGGGCLAKDRGGGFWGEC